MKNEFNRSRSRGYVYVWFINYRRPNSVNMQGWSPVIGVRVTVIASQARLVTSFRIVVKLIEHGQYELGKVGHHFLFFLLCLLLLVKLLVF